MSADYAGSALDLPDEPDRAAAPVTIWERWRMIIGPAGRTRLRGTDDGRGWSQLKVVGVDAADVLKDDQIAPGPPARNGGL
jgi:hypothetical protein